MLKSIERERSMSCSTRELRRIERQFHPLALEIEDTPPSPLPRVLVWVISMLAITAITWSYCGQIDVVSTAEGRVIPDGRLKVLQTMDAAIIRAIHVREGASVRKGQLLVELDPTVSNADLSSSAERMTIARLELVRLRAELTGAPADYRIPGARADIILLQETLRAARESNFSAKQAEARSILQSKEMARAAAQDSLRKLAASARLAAEKEARVRPYVGTVMSRFEYLKLKDELSQAENDLAAQRNQVDDLSQQCAAAEQRIKQIEKERQSQIITDINDSMARLASLNAEFGKAAQFSAQKQLRSPVDGIIQVLNVATPGGVVTPGQTLATIVPSGTPLVVEAQLSNEDIGFVRVGQEVNIKLNAYPFQKYGTVSGVVISISPDAEPEPSRPPTNASLAPASTKSIASYRALIKPLRTDIDINGIRKNISTGMTVQADIKTDRRRIIEFFLSPVLKYLDEGLKLR